MAAVKCQKQLLLSFVIKSVSYHSRDRIQSRKHFFKCKNRSKSKNVQVKSSFHLRKSLPLSPFHVT